MKPVRIYTTVRCTYCDRAKELLRRRGVPYEEIDLSGDDEGRADLVRRSGGMRTVPQIWIGDHHVGGYAGLVELDRSGRLDAMLRG